MGMQRGGAVMSRHRLAAGTARLVMLAALCLLACIAGPRLAAAQTTASLNRPEGSPVTTSTVTSSTPNEATRVGPSSTSVAAPQSTDVAPIDLSPQQVPYLLGSPVREARNFTIGAGGAVRGPAFVGCDDSTDETQYAIGQSRINISAVYTQFDHALEDSALGLGNPFSAGTLRIVAVGTVGNESHAFGTSTDASGAVTGLLSAIQVSSSFVSFPLFDNYTYLCDRLYPTGNDTVYPNVSPASCQYGPGTVAFGVDIPLNHTYEAGTIWTQIRLTDPSTPPLTLACIEVQASPYYPEKWYWAMIFYVPIAIVAVLMVVTTLALLITAETNQRMAFRHRAREGGAPSFFKDTVRPMMISALGGKEQIQSPPLLRFITPGIWDIIWHLQFLVAIAMCHVEWPDFVYPFFRQLSWSALLGNVTLVEDISTTHGLLHTNATLPDGDIGAQMENATSPLYMNASQPNSLLNLGNGAEGIRTYASAIGLQSSSLFGTSLIIWLAIIAIIVAASVLGWLTDALFEAYYRHQYRKAEASGEIVGSWTSEAKRSSGQSPEGSTRPLTRHGMIGSRFRGHLGSHSRALHGNIVRAIVLFHLPITIVCTWQMAAASEHSGVSVGLAAFAFAFLSVLAPIYIIVRLATRSAKDLYENTHDLLSLGSVYHMFAPGSQLFIIVVFVHHLVLGIVVGAGQGSGAAQAIVILIVEIASALIWSLWLPWGEGAMMGPITFMSGVVRIATAVLVLLLTSLVGLSKEARGWLAYVVLLLQGIWFLAILLVVAVKVVEALVRVACRLRFDERTSGRTAGLSGAIRKLKRRKYKKHRPAKTSRKIQLRSIRPSSHRRQESVGTLSSLNMMEKSTPQRTPGGMTDARRAYLEKGTPGYVPSSRPMSGEYDYFNQGRPMSRPASTLVPTLARTGHQDESESIMAAMPPLTPPGLDSTAQAGTFVRVGGGRATDSDPYRARTGMTPAGHGPTSPTSAAWSYSTPAYQAVRGRGSHEAQSSTQLAAHSARQSLLDAPYGNAAASSSQKRTGGFRDRLRRAWGRSAHNGSSDDDSDDDDDDGYESELAGGAGRGQGKGFGRMGAALGGMRKAFNGKPSATPAEERPETPSTPAKGFEVVRQPRPKTPKTKGDAPTAAAAPTRAQEHQEQQEQLLQASPSQAQERSAEDFYRTSDAQSTPEGASAYETMDARQDEVGEPERSPSALDYYSQQPPLGSAASAQHVRAPSSAGEHRGAETGAGGTLTSEDQFWLPPLNLRSSNEHHRNEGPVAR